MSDHLAAPRDELLDYTFETQLVTLKPASQDDLRKKVSLSVDGVDVTVRRAVVVTDPDGEPVRDENGDAKLRYSTIYDAAAAAFQKNPGDKNPIPILCHREHMTPAAACRVCMVEVCSRGRSEGSLAPACHRTVDEGVEVRTVNTSEKVRRSVRMVTELLMSDQPDPSEHGKSFEELEGDDTHELSDIARRLEVPVPPRFPNHATPKGSDATSPLIMVDHSACILCDRCIRACTEVKENFVIGRTGSGYDAKIGFDLNDPMGNSSCVACGECAFSCPTDALQLKEPPRYDRREPGTTDVAPEELSSLPLFSEISRKYLRFNKQAYWRKTFKRGEVVCTEGEYGSTAFVVEGGKFAVSARARGTHIEKKRGGLFALFGGYRQEVVADTPDRRSPTAAGPTADARSGRNGSGSVDPATAMDSFDGGPPTGSKGGGRGVGVGPAGVENERIPPEAFAGLPLPPGRKFVGMIEGAGTLFGEMACLSHYPRSATVIAAEDGASLLVVRRNLLYMLQRDETARRFLTDKFRKNSCAAFLGSVPLFDRVRPDADRFAELVAFVGDRIDLVQVSPGQQIYSEGDRAECYDMIRTGYVRVSQAGPGGEEIVRNYLGPNSYIGETALLSKIEPGDPPVEQLPTALLPPGVARGVRSASCRSVDHVELVRIGRADFLEMCHRFPEVMEHILDDLRAYRGGSGEEVWGDTHSLEQFLEQGLQNARSLLVLDLEKCTRCDECTKACADVHGGTTRLIRDGLRYDKFLVASSCRSCQDPYCMVGCPVDSIHRRKSGEMTIEDWCIGCGLCAENCPYGNINMARVPSGDQKASFIDRMFRRGADGKAEWRTQATLCDLCADAPGDEPSCVYACPHDAAHRMSGQELLNIVRGGGA